MSNDYARGAVLTPVRRMTAYRKYCLLEAVRSGVVTREEAMTAHGISAEEWANWSARVGNTVEALKVTKTQSLRGAR